MTNTPKPITLEFTLDELGQIHDALLALPMRRVEALVSRIRAAAAEAVQASQPKAGCGGCHAQDKDRPAQEEPTP